jgi:hypothetical protein
VKPLQEKIAHGIPADLDLAAGRLTVLSNTGNGRASMALHQPRPEPA